MNERLLAGPYISFQNGFYGKSQVHKTEEKNVIIKDKLFIVNIKFNIIDINIILA